MIWNLDALVAHVYFLALAVAAGLTFGAGYAFIPLAVGMMLLVVSA